MAIQLEGNIEALRIYEYLTKVLDTGDLANYFLLIDKSGDARAQNVSLATLLAFSGSQFYDNLFKLISNLDDDELTFVLDNLTGNRAITVPDISGLMAVAGMADAFSFGGQAHGGSYTKTFSATGTFDADDGNNQRMVCTGDSTINITNEEPGVFILDLPISGGGVSSLTLGASLGQAYPNNDSLAYTDGSINTITVFVNANGDKRYTITAYEA